LDYSRWQKNIIASDGYAVRRKNERADEMKLIINSDRAFSESIKALHDAYKENRYLRVTATTSKDRTLDQNALFAALYVRISETLGDGTAQDISEFKKYCKLVIGVPIMRRDDERFNNGWNRYFAGRSYEEQLFLMGDNPLFGVDGFPVTRLFDTKQGAEYTESVVRHFAQQSVFFEDLLDNKKRKYK
jgi:hypothetical protein